MYRIFAAAVLLVFYGIYFTKMLLQKMQGIQTRQIGRRKEKDIHAVESLMALATILAPAAQALSILLDWSWLPDSARFTGFLLGLIGDGVFLIAVITMKNSWRAGIPESDKTELVQTGIYKWSRNPAFLGFDFMYVGVCLLFCNPVTIVFSLFAIVMLHLQILQEEKYLSLAFGAPYAQYKKSVFRYLGRKNAA
ncbi:MAG: isoprenylcysteine carboxylmethyltransferase family protein [Eubacteriales bacterium]|nr:isoprenylcysteine carboxylmethyltransferase family protein [Eubacteriales bacterium]MDD3882921.1 isoprenylcysteine carboxylmethyltransferase family protein [Eubacteriales bacterium]MDD4513911.1 isoprenylcysteine carboxylmethyltransferase family protein [Eubacteriales bacterium]